MNYTELIYRFIDRDLDPTNEDILFQQLYEDKELRGELISSISLEKEMGRKMTAFAPGSTETAGVFSALGFAPAGVSSVGGGAGAATLTSLSTTSGLGSVWSGFLTVLFGIGAFFGLSITGDVLDSSHLFSGDDFSSKSINQDLFDNKNLIDIIEEHTDVIPIQVPVALDNNKDSRISGFGSVSNGNSSSSQAQSRLGSRFENTPQRSVNPVHTPASNSVYLEESVNGSDLANIRIVEKTDLMFANKQFLIHDIEPPGTQRPTVIQSLESQYGSDRFPDGEEVSLDAKLATNRIEVRSFSSFADLPELGGDNSAILSDIGVAFLTPFADGFELGISFDRKSYYLEYTAQTEDGQFDYKQNTVYSSLQAVGQYLPLGFENAANPFLRTGVGFTSLGPSGSAMVGFYVPIIGNAEAMIGYGGQAIGFWVDESFYNSINHGLQIGLSLDL